MSLPKHVSREETQRRLDSANLLNIPMFIKTGGGPSEYRRVHGVRLTEEGFLGTKVSPSPWDNDVAGDVLVIAHERLRCDLHSLDKEHVTPCDIVLQCQSYVESLPSAVSGQNGHHQTQHVAEVIFHDFALDTFDGWTLLLEYNCRCEPCWSVTALRRFMEQAMKHPPRTRVRGALRNKFIVETFDHEK